MPVDPNTVRLQLKNLAEWREAYYNGNAMVSDAIYDAIEDEVREASAELPAGDPLKAEIDAFLAKVGAPVPGGSAGDHWVKAKHKAPMGSLNKAQVESEMRDWFKVKTGTLVWSDKCDGISIALYYENGDLVQAVTRGDGVEGEDITRNVRTMKGVVPRIKGLTGFVRGEIVLRKTDWKAHFPTYSNPRNAAAGISKRIDGQGSEHLTVLHYQIVRFDGKTIPAKNVELQVLQAVVATLPNWGVVATVDEIQAIYQSYVGSKRDALDYDIDGLVIEYDALDVRDSLGELNNRPRGAVAYKFPHESKPTILRGIRWQVGNTGRITPVAEFDTISLAGAKISQASLHNVTRVQKLKLFVGCRIMVSRRNDVIPMVESNLDEGVSVDDIDT
jgi:DNA ligase (NAD+)